MSKTVSPAVSISREDAQRLSWLMKEMSDLLQMQGPNRLSDAQVSALCEGQVGHREELTNWTRKLHAELGRPS